ncbi:unnamed protein product [Pleuronectes platessa]|uniref:Uncharacterized protein n=1 Tax=Pleuronectes platessa TaxID=8262 RepID=A0A9N7VDM4_PLEPL|nr:unnamed protein product [Pleuronectes platessa]
MKLGGELSQQQDDALLDSCSWLLQQKPCQFPHPAAHHCVEGEYQRITQRRRKWLLVVDIEVIVASLHPPPPLSSSSSCSPPRGSATMSSSLCTSHREED